jgi:hypothetical protein
MAKVFSPLSKNNTIVSAYCFETENNEWQIFSDSETLSRMLALYDECELEPVPFFNDIEETSVLCINISHLVISCPLEDLAMGNHWLLRRRDYKVDVTMFDVQPEDVPELLFRFRQ